LRVDNGLHAHARDQVILGDENANGVLWHYDSGTVTATSVP
jgi:hypothetical protein